MQIYINKNGQQLGPFEEAKVLEMLQKSEINDNDLVFRQGDSEWSKVGSLYPTNNHFDEDDTQIYTSENDKFSVWFPVAPKIERTMSNIRLEVRNYTVVDDAVEVEISVCDLEEADYSTKMKSKIYDGIRDGLVADTEGKLLLYQDVVISDQDGRSLEVLGAGIPGVFLPSSFLQNFFIKDSKLYLLRASLSSEKKSQNTELVKKFFDSFILLGKKT